MVLISHAFDIHQRPFGAKLTEEQSLFTHHPDAILRKVEVGNDSAGVNLANERSKGIPYMYLSGNQPYA